MTSARVQVAGVSLALADGTDSTRTTDSAGNVTHRFFVEPVIIVAVGALDPAGASALELAASIRAAYARTDQFVREHSGLPVAVDGAETAVLRFRWGAESGDEQASRLLVVRRGEEAVVVHVALPGARLPELEQRVDDILQSVELDPRKTGADQRVR